MHAALSFVMLIETLTFLCRVHKYYGCMFYLAHYMPYQFPQLKGPNVYPGVPHDYTKEVSVYVRVSFF